MVEQSKPESVTQRFAVYIEELREFFTSRSLHYGVPADVVEFGRQVAQPTAFAEEMGSMVRTIMYQADERLGRGELLQMVLVAVGGPEMEGTEHEELQPAVRQIFRFLNATLRERQHGMPALAENQAPITAGDMLAAAAAPSTPQESQRLGAAAETGPMQAPARPTQPVQARMRPSPSPEQVSVRRDDPPESRLAWSEAPGRGEPAAGTEVLFRAMSLSAEQNGMGPLQSSTALDDMPRETLRQRWLVPAIAGCLAVVGIGAYLARPLLRPHQTAPAVATPAPETTTATGAYGESACGAPIAPGVSRSGLEVRSRWAHNLLNQKLYQSALPELREIARLDPGFPGVKLDESEALLHLKRPEDALEAIDAQISSSECLARLPRPALEAYCRMQFPGSTMSTCMPELNHIRQAAELQAALVHLELGHRVMPDADGAGADLGAEASGVVRQPRSAVARAASARHLEPLPPATEGDADVPAMPAPAPVKAPAQAKVRHGGKPQAGDDALMHGEGTDSAYGAYQKPE